MIFKQLCSAAMGSHKLLMHWLRCGVDAGSTVALLLHPFRPLLAAVDGKGMLRVHNYRHNTLANKFHISGQHACTCCRHVLQHNLPGTSFIQG